MSDLDKLLTPAVSRAAEDATRVPDLTTIRRAGQRRQRSRVALTGACTAAAVLAVVVGVQLLPRGVERTEGPDPATPATVRESVVRDPESRLIGLAISSTDPDVRVAAWARCNEDCRFAVVHTSDRFAHRTVLDLPTRQEFGVTSLGDDAFLVASTDGSWVVGPDGDLTPTSEGPSGGPLRATERVPTLVDMPSGLRVPDPAMLAGVVVDPDTGARRALPGTAGSFDLLEQPSGALVSWPGGPNVAVSLDKGASWTQRRLSEPGDNVWVTPVRSAHEEVLAVVVSSGELPGLRSVWRSDDGGVTWDRFPLPRPLRSGSLLGAAVEGDGSLTVVVAQAKASGFYRSGRRDWSTWWDEPMPEPFADASGIELAPVAVETSAGEVRWYLESPEAVGGPALVSTDGGRTFSEVRAR